MKTTHQVANYPGFVDPIPGYQLARNMKEQAQRFGTRFNLAAEVTDVHLDGVEKSVTVDGEKFTADNVIIAAGSSPRLLNVPGESEYKGSGISYCATCDGEFYKDKDIIVIGGGNSAMEESLLLLQYVHSITVIHQFDGLQAEKITADKILSNPKVSVLWSHEPRKFAKKGERMVVTAENLKTHELETIERDGVFIFVGMQPNTELIKDTGVKTNEWGYIPTSEEMETNLPGVYAVGDVRVKKYRQITTAVADGTIAALEIIKKR